MSKRRVVVTGLGAVSPLGLTVPESWSNIVAGKSGVTHITHFDASNFACQISAPVKNFNPENYITPKDVRKLDTFAHYAVAAAQEAMQDAGLTVTPDNAHRLGVAIGSGIGGLPAIEKNHTLLRDGGPKKILPFFIPSTIINIAPGYISMLHGLKGPNISVVTACTTSTHNIGLAARLIQYGDADVMLSGGAEMASSPLGIGGFCACRAVSLRNDAPERASRPWDKDRDGFVLGDGAGVLILEEYEHAIKRGAKIYAELTGFGMSADAYHLTSPQPEGEGEGQAMRNALQDAKISPSQIDYINAHGTSTPAGDVVEVKAVKNVFGDHAKKLAMSSTKSMTGHLLGAAGAIEAIFSVLALRDQVAPPTINLDHPDEGCDLDFLAHTARKMKINTVLSNSFGFGGTNGTLIFKRWEGTDV